MTSAPASPLAAPPAQPPRYVRVLTIAGSDSGGGAGIQADLKTFAALGCYGMSAITALTAQNTRGVQGIHGVPPEFVRAQIDAVVGDIGVDAVKIGMLATPEVVHAVADAIEAHGLPHVVLDPVMVATSGDRLIAESTVAVLIERLFPLAELITPNLDEAELLLAQAIDHAQGLDEAAQALRALGAPAALLKGGHLPGDWVVDVLATAGGCERLESARIVTHNGHGTGCTLSSAIAAHLALGHGLSEAVGLARAYILNAIAAGADVVTGHGHGPLNHGFAPVAQRIGRA
ncbi:bifunctional hydroxymethylpyrimidine kinase/phosphomethylpyrimidine kinase [Comamonas serinivorans]|uniref:hydroxymethylpyrimidine kinase n=1 Tax=Comamonas serinivorans TaxID=1082851 RepID=A0A1Y0EPS9_9BURK|nr:bifunctional hydroxymethylpyrimidine kinase/phosphomethylpyrimidine kinase [Comamonas serinivorans]ARU05655.1 bifunctional hydroxymethylpyrimidine kinase/phosphomethylpyrimidine kinase [Comamonas serinivorans]